ncbi:MAG: hypothetical protein JW969_14145 [Spirochaetales bacterium]|nr:hypothetical protein [Spirochaetales bacterium]
MWYRMDNTGTVFSLISAKRITWLFRIAATLAEPVDIAVLQEALNMTILRYPYFRVHMRWGVFWHYWDSVQGMPRVIRDSQFPCEKMKLGWKGILPFRLRATYNRVAVEFHHSVTDGTGAINFFETLICQYFSLKGVRINDWGNVLCVTDTPEPAEWEDAYKIHYNSSIPKPEKYSRAYQLPYKVLRGKEQYIITGVINLSDLQNVTREKGVSLTEYLVAVYLDALQDIYFSREKKASKPLRILVPVDGRKMYATRTMRNFFFPVLPGIDPRLGREDFDDILKEVHHFMRIEVTARYINQQLKRNIASEFSPIIRFMPLFLKKILMSLAYKRLGEYQRSGVFSNLGIITLPAEVKERITSFQFLPASTPIVKTICGAVSYNGMLYLSFCRLIKEPYVEKLFFRKLVKAGIPVKISG